MLGSVHEESEAEVVLDGAGASGLAAGLESGVGSIDTKKICKQGSSRGKKERYASLTVRVDACQSCRIAGVREAAVLGSRAVGTERAGVGADGSRGRGS